MKMKTHSFGFWCQRHESYIKHLITININIILMRKFFQQKKNYQFKSDSDKNTKRNDKLQM